MTRKDDLPHPSLGLAENALFEVKKLRAQLDQIQGLLEELADDLSLEACLATEAPETSPPETGQSLNVVKLF